MIIRSQRLSLVPMGREFLHASLRSDPEEAGRLIDATVPASWPGELSEVLKMRLSQIEADPAIGPWLLRAMVLAETEEMIGCIGFHTTPGPAYLEEHSPGAVEFGFEVFPEFRRQGFALEAIGALLGWARNEQDQRSFIVTIRPDNEASQALAARLGFVRIGSHLDDIDGLEDVLELKIS